MLDNAQYTGWRGAGGCLIIYQRQFSKLYSQKVGPQSLKVHAFYKMQTLIQNYQKDVKSILPKNYKLNFNMS